MATERQSTVPTYRETSNIGREKVDYYKNRPEKQPGYGLARLLGTVQNVGGQMAKEHMAKTKKENLEKGRQLAMMGVERSNLKEASGGGFDMGGWTMEGFDTQRGIEDAFMRSGEIIDAYNQSGLWQSDDPVAFQNFITERRTALLDELKELPEAYRNGFMEGIAPTFQKAYRTHAGHMTTFRTTKKVHALKERIRSDVRSLKGAGGNGRGSVNDAVDMVINDVEKGHGLPKSQARDAAAEVLIEEVRAGNVDPEAIDEKKFSKKNQRKIQEAVEQRDADDEARAVVEEKQAAVERAKTLEDIIAKTDIGPARMAALKELEALDPDLARKVQERTVEAMQEPVGNLEDPGNISRVRDDNYRSRIRTVDGTEESSIRFAEDFADGRINERQYRELLRLNKVHNVSQDVMNNSLTRARIDVTLDSIRDTIPPFVDLDAQKPKIEMITREIVADFVEMEQRKPNTTEMRQIITEASAEVLAPIEAAAKRLDVNADAPTDVSEAAAGISPNPKPTSKAAPGASPEQGSIMEKYSQ